MEKLGDSPADSAAASQDGLRFKDMETIFDHNVTKEEMMRFVGPYDIEEAFAEGPSMYTNENDANYALGILFSMRDDKEKAKHYFEKITNKELLQILWQDFP